MCFDEVTFRAPKAHFIFWEVALFDVLAREDKDTAMAFLAEISKAEYQDDLPKYITYGPTNKAAFDTGVIDAATAAMLPSSPANAALQLPVSLEWYAKWKTIADEMYQSMLTE